MNPITLRYRCLLNQFSHYANYDSKIADDEQMDHKDYNKNYELPAIYIRNKQSCHDTTDRMSTSFSRRDVYS